MTVRSLHYKRIRTDGGTQPRVEISQPLVCEYANLLKEGVELPPVTVFGDGTEFWLADGFHRYRAWCWKFDDHEIPEEERMVPCDLRPGMLRDAILHSVGANATHGLRRTNEDKRRAVETLLSDEKWYLWSDSQIARQCCVSHPFVGKIRREMRGEADGSTEHHSSHPAEVNADGLSCNVSRCDDVRTVERGDSVYRQNTANIGRSSGPPPPLDGDAAGAAAPPTPPPPPPPPPPGPDTEPSPAPDRKHPRDAVGRPIPKSLLPMFQRAKEELQPFVTQLSVMRTTIERRTEDRDLLFAHCHWNSLKTLMDRVYCEVKALLPYAVCPYCQGSGELCRACHGSGFVTKETWNVGCPREIREAAIAADREREEDT